MRKSDALISKLLAAEEKAERIVQTARDHRTKVVREATIAAEAEISVIRLEEEARLEKVMQSKSFDDEEAKIKSVTVKEMEDVKLMFTRNREKTAKYIFDKVLAVDKSLTQIQTSSLAGDAEEGAELGVSTGVKRQPRAA
jgi:vacuolar-type H+-ATPase subunit H